MEQIKNSPFKLDTFTILESHITRKPNKMTPVDVKIKPFGLLTKPKKNFSLHLDVFLKDEDSFDINIKCVGSFLFQDDISEQDLSKYFITNAPAIIFPYIRAYVSALTALSGLPAVNLPVMNLTSLRKELEQNIVEAPVKTKKLKTLK